MYHVLIVDEEEHLLWALKENLFPQREDVSIRTATSGEDGLALLREHPVDLLVSDIKMPGRIDGFQLILRAKEVAPDARVMIMTAFGTNRIQNFADRIGITHYIEKPFKIEELRDAILEIFDEKEGFQSVLSELELTDIIQMLCLARRTALLHLKYKDHRGKIVFDKGDVVHAEFDGNVGEEAVYEMLALRQGDIFTQSDFTNDEKTIELGWQDLLFEGVKRADEKRLAAASEAEEEERGPDTDVGMGVAPADASEQVEVSQEEELSQSFFSEAELREIEEAASEANLPPRAPDVGASASARDVAAAAMIADPGPATTEDSGEFRAPFRPDDGTPAVPRSLTPAAIPVIERSLDFGTLLEEFARECPGMKVTLLVSEADGLALHHVQKVNGAGYDPEAISAFFQEVVKCAQQTAVSLDPKDRLDELQIALTSDYVLVRAVEEMGVYHLAVVDKTISLGVALVLMRRFQRDVYRALEGV